MADGLVRHFPPRTADVPEARAGSVRPDDDGSRSGDPDLLAGVPDAVYRLDRRGRFTYLNPAAETLLERRAEDLLCRDALECFPTLRGSVVEERFREVHSSGQPRQFEFFFGPQDRWY